MVQLHKEGHKILIFSLIILVLINWVLKILVPDYTIARFIVLACSIILYLLFLNFFRNPLRDLLIDEQTVVAPADGKVVVIEEVEEPEYFKDKRMQISIFMSPTNVHVNRNAIGGEIKYTKYHPGKYLVAWHPKSSSENERNTVVIQNNRAEVLMRQIAGAAARRIRSYVNIGDVVSQGNEFGFIKFGSRVDVFLPLSAEVEVTLNQKVRGGETVLAKI